MSYKKCPICDTNYISEQETMCVLCSKKDNVKSRKSYTKKSNVVFGETFTIENKQDFFKGKQGYIAYNQKMQKVGLIYACDDKRLSAYDKCQLCFYEKYINLYGQWHIIRSHGNYIDWVELCSLLKHNKTVSIFVD